MKSVFIFTAVFLFVGICSVAAQDLIILKDGNTIAAKVSEISPTEIRYKRFDNLDGPTIVIPADRVLSIRYQNGTQEIINADAGQKNTQAKSVDTTPPIDPDKFIFAFSANPSGFLPMFLGFGEQLGPSVCFEFGKGHFNSEVHLIFFPFWYVDGSFGGLATFNYFWHNSVGGFYLGGGIGYILLANWKEDEEILTVGLNIGWKFVLRSGLYFRTGTYLGIANSYTGVYIKPDLAIGYCFK